MASHLPPLSRRRLLALGSAGLWLPAGLVLPRPTRAASAPERKMLFVFCTGGWDPTECLAPMLGTVVDNNGDVQQAEANGIPYVTSPSRPWVDTFFESYGDRMALVHGIEARSVAHDVCLRLMLTGGTLATGNDWPSTLAAASRQDLLLPMAHISGPAYATSASSSVVRVGSNGQLAALLDGSALDASTLPNTPPSALAEDRLDALVTERIAAAAEQAGAGRARTIAQQAVLADHRLVELREVGAELDLSGSQDFVGQASVVAELMSRGICRTGMVEFYGFQGLSWDTHADHPLQGQHFNTLMQGLVDIMADLDARTGTGGGPLSDEVTVVVLSEMGRYPKINSRGGKEHWTYTSAMMLGAGVRGGTVVGGYDAETFTGRPVDLVSGQLDAGGTPLVPGHLGATLLAMAGEDPTLYSDDYAPLDAVLAD